MMRTRLRNVLAALLVLAVVNVHAAVADGDTAPNDLGTMRDGTAIHTQQFRGKVVVVTFWATWCKYCMRELPILANIQRLAGHRLQVVAISHDENRRTYIQVTRRIHNLGLILAYDGDNKAAHAFDVHGIPHMVMIDSDGRIAHIHVGYSKDMLPAIAKELNTLLATVPQSVAVSRPTARPPAQ